MRILKQKLVLFFKIKYPDPCLANLVEPKERMERFLKIFNLDSNTNLFMWPCASYFPSLGWCLLLYKGREQTRQSSKVFLLLLFIIQFHSLICLKDKLFNTFITKFLMKIKLDCWFVYKILWNIIVILGNSNFYCWRRPFRGSFSSHWVSESFISSQTISAVDNIFSTLSSRCGMSIFET